MICFNAVSGLVPADIPAVLSAWYLKRGLRHKPQNQEPGGQHREGRRDPPQLGRMSELIGWESRILCAFTNQAPQ